jgi:hypothetical protein
VDLRASLDAEARKKILCLCRESNSSHPVYGQMLYSLSYHGSSMSRVQIYKSMIDFSFYSQRMELELLFFLGPYQYHLD